MKTSILFLSLALLASCSTKPTEVFKSKADIQQEKLKAAITLMMNKTLNDPTVYVPVNYRIDTVSQFQEIGVYKVRHDYRNKLIPSQYGHIQFEVKTVDGDQYFVTDFKQLQGFED